MEVKVTSEAVYTMWDAVTNASSCVGGAGEALEDGMNEAGASWHDIQFERAASKIRPIAKKFQQKAKQFDEIAQKLLDLKHKIDEYVEAK